MPHPDPRVEAIRRRNRRDRAHAVGAPPPDIADDPAAYLAWCQQSADERPVAPTGAKGSARVVRPELSRRPNTSPSPPPVPVAIRLDGRTCACGALLDRDGTCFACAPRIQLTGYPEES